MAIIVGFNIVLLFLFVPETFWDRTPRPKSRRSSLIHRFNDLAQISGFMSNNDRSAGNSEGNLDEGEKDYQPRNSTQMNRVTPQIGQRTSSLRDALHSKPKHIETRSFKEQLYPWNGQTSSRFILKGYGSPISTIRLPSSTMVSNELCTLINVGLNNFRSTVVYSLSIGWLIVLSESVAHIYQTNPYNFSRLSTGLVYISPFIGGVLGTAIAGKVSDVIVRAMAKRNGGVYEPEFRLVMAIPLTIATAMGLMGYEPRLCQNLFIC